MRCHTTEHFQNVHLMAIKKKYIEMVQSMDLTIDGKQFNLMRK